MEGAEQTSATIESIPVTLLSGFLGSGKTTLLEHILRNKQDLRCAVIVNDMAEVNIDSALIRNGSLVQAEEKLVELQNGCICCTLREDLLLEVTKLAKAGAFDAIVIESTGISEPMQVAETFTFEDEAGKSLQEIARLDTCVTVVDSSLFRENMSSILSLSEKFREKESIPEDDDRNVCDLLLDQLEFADVILLNKADLVPRKEMDSLKAAIKMINPRAKVFTTTRSVIPLENVLCTGLFDLEKASNAPGWLASLRGEGPLVPETEEYGIGSFIYRSRKPFHPERLGAVFEKYFMLQEIVVDAGHEHDHDHDHSGATGDGTKAGSLPQETEQEEDDDESVDDNEEEMDADKENLLLERLKEAAAVEKERTARWGSLFRSKGFIWIGSLDKHNVIGSWGQAGNMLTLSPYGPWFSVLPRSDWPTEEVLKDFCTDEFIGDRRQEIVFIGQSLEKNTITEELDRALLTDEEYEIFKSAVQSSLPPSFTTSEEPKGKTSASLPWESCFEEWNIFNRDIEDDETEEQMEE